MKTSASFRATFFMCAATLLFTFMQAGVRFVASDVHPFEVAFFRNFFGLIVIIPLLYRSGVGALRTKKIHLHAMRGILQTFGMLLFFSALILSPLAQNVALSFTAPLFTVVLAVLILGESSGWRRWVALVIGFIGAWIVIRPGFAVVNLGGFLVIFSSIAWAGSMIIIKYISRSESSLTLTLYMGLFMAPLSLVPALFVWSWPSWENFALLFCIGAFGGIGHLALAAALKEGDAGAVLPLDFLRLIWASILGFVIFSEVPDAFTWLGGSVIFLSTSYIAYREIRLKRQARFIHDPS